VAADGSIVTGVARHRIETPFLGVVDEAVQWSGTLELPEASLLLYGSVATGAAVVGRSDVDLLAVGISNEQAHAMSSALSDSWGELCRGVEVSAVSHDDLTKDGDEAHGLLVFLRHYCVPLAGRDQWRALPPCAADAAAARGFNGDIDRHLERWRVSTPDLVLCRRAARKSLLAAAGLHSVLDATWTTDRARGAAAWRRRRPDLAEDIHHLEHWASLPDPSPRQDTSSTSLAQFPTDSEVAPRLTAMLSERGALSCLGEEFVNVIGAWR